MKKLGKLIIIMLAVFGFSQCYAELDAKGQANLKAKISKQFPGIELGHIKPSPIKGIYELTAGMDLVYTSEDGRYIFDGDIIDLGNNRYNITENARKSVRLEVLDKIGEENMIVFSPKDPKYTVTVFTDIDCGYCRKLHKEINELMAGGMRVRYLAYPRAGVGSKSFDKAVSVWCAKDPNSSLTQAKLGQDVPEATCKNPVQDEFNTGRVLGVTGTPTIIYEDGHMQPGYMPAERFLKTAAEHTPKK